jgi:hypothetical protein
VNQLAKSAAARRKLAKQLQTSEATLRYAARFAEVVRISDAKRLHGCSWRVVLDVIGANTERQRSKIIDAAIGADDGTRARRTARRVTSRKYVPRFRSDLYDEMWSLATKFATACEVFEKRAREHETTDHRRQKLQAALEAVRQALAAAQKATRV